MVQLDMNGIRAESREVEVVGCLAVLVTFTPQAAMTRALQPSSAVATAAQPVVAIAVAAAAEPLAAIAVAAATQPVAAIAVAAAAEPLATIAVAAAPPTTTRKKKKKKKKKKREFTMHWQSRVLT